MRVERKWLDQGQNDAIDPERTSDQIGEIDDIGKFSPVGTRKASNPCLPPEECPGMILFTEN